jgi:cytochrome oxidase Cu insertion factor (SCO1/SenC/PrrC family)
MPGMGSSLQTNNPVVVAAFKSALAHQGLIVLLMLALLAVAWNTLRRVQLRQATAGGGHTSARATDDPASLEPAALRLLRIAFGCIWVFDGILQAQSSMPLGLGPGVIAPAASSSPAWVQHVMSFGLTIWNNHPVPAAAATVWIQIGIGLFLLVAPRGNWLRLAGLASVSWGLIVWVFGEAFGSIFAPGLTWLFGAPGGVVFYIIAGVLITLPEHFWLSPRLGRAVLGLMGFFFVGMAVLQSWPGRGFWQGQPDAHGVVGTLTGMVQSMAQTSQPGFLSSFVANFAAFDAAHGWAVNLVAVIALAAIGIAFVVGRPRVVFWAVIAGAVLCLADWVLIEDLGFLGGLGTDPNSMVPMLLIFVAGYLAITRLPFTGSEPVLRVGASQGSPSWWGRFISRPTYVLRSLAAIGAVLVVPLGAAPMVAAATNPVADPILTEAINGDPGLTNFVATPFQLVDQNGKAVALRHLRRKVVALTFLDPVCTSDCPLIAQEFHEADQMLGALAPRTDFIAIVANPIYRSVATTFAFTNTDGLAKVKNWLFLTGSRSALARIWDAYGVQVAVEPAGAMVAHNDISYVIDKKGRVRDILDADPGSGTAPMRSSFAGLLVGEIRHLLATP